jgi:fatty acid desaturase
MSTFTVVHHTAPHIPFKPAEEWNAAKAQLSGGSLWASLVVLLVAVPG